MKSKVKRFLEEYDFDFEDKIIDGFISFLSFLFEENEKYNIASRKDEDFFEKVFIDSLIPLKVLGSLNGSLLDIGSGNGFPGIILKLANPDLKVTLLDAEMKKIRFLEKAVEHLNIDIDVIYARAEDHKKKCADKYDYVTAKALVSKPLKWLQWTVPFLKKGGISINYKTEKFIEELELTGIKKYLKGRNIKTVENYSYKVSDVNRNIVLLKKV